MFDGPDYVGKTTQIELAAKELTDAGLEVCIRRLSGGTDIGEALRRISFDPALKRPPRTDLYIILAMNSALAEDLRPLRDRGVICLVDRSPLSILAYQVYGSGLSEDEGNQGIRDALRIFSPDLLLCYVAPLDVLQKRRSKREPVAKDYFGNQPLDFVERVMAGYRDAAERYEAEVIDAAGSIDAIHLATMRHVRRYI